MQTKTKERPKYRIKLLEWVTDSKDNAEADNPLAELYPEYPYRVIREEDGGFAWREPQPCAWHGCDSIAHGQQLAQEHYERRLLAALEPAEEK